MIDVVEVLTGTERPRKYRSDLKTKLIEEGYSELSDKIGQLKLMFPDGKLFRGKIILKNHKIRNY